MKAKPQMDYLLNPFLPIIVIAVIATMVVSSQSAVTSAQEDASLFNVSCSKDNQKQNSEYQYNLFVALSSLTAQASTHGFFNYTSRDAPNTVYALYLCRGDDSGQVCNDCVVNAKNSIVKVCPNQVEALIWYDRCMIRYSNQNFFGEVDESTELTMCNRANVSGIDQERFMQLVNDTIYRVAKVAAIGDRWGRKFAVQEVNYSTSSTLYVLEQCTPDLSFSDCHECLSDTVDSLFVWCDGKQGGRKFFSTSCSTRYEIYRFYDELLLQAPTPAPAADELLLQAPTPAPAASELRPPASNTKKTVKELTIPIIGIVIAAAAVGACVLIIVAILFFLQRRKEKEEHGASSSESAAAANLELLTIDSIRYDLFTLKLATDNFSDTNKIGKGGFGVVYKGTLANGQEIAVKRLTTSSERGTEEFQNEVLLVAKLQHKNLVRLMGFCLDGEERLLVFEFVPNKSLDFFLFDPDKQAQLDGRTRCKIIQGTARGLLYLHEDSRDRIIHRDLKAANVLLDASMNPKISDFGTAKLVGTDQSLNQTDLAIGTLGYMAPEYLIYAQYSVKSDVYSFGVLLLEIISGKRVRSSHQLGVGQDLLNVAWKHWSDGEAWKFMDQNMVSSYDLGEEIERWIQLGLLCVQPDLDRRPTMVTVVNTLNNLSVTKMPVPQQPVFFNPYAAPAESSSSSARKMFKAYSWNGKSTSSSSSVTRTAITEP
ncbi:Cysteine-rich receptor-like protein [Drosera capensis]